MRDRCPDVVRTLSQTDKNHHEKVWNEKWELTCGYFYGFEPAREISAEEAKAYMVRHGAAGEEAEEFIRKDMED